MKFDVIIGNPPYQLSDGGAQASAMPIYQKFVQQAKALNPKYISMIMPSRWMACGKGLDDFRDEMLSDRRFVKLVDFVNPKECFPSNDIKGGVCYFLWDRDHNGECDIETNMVGGQPRKSRRFLREDGCDVFIRDEILISILNKVTEASKEMLVTIVSPSKPYGLRGETMVNATKYGLPEFSNNEIAGGGV